MQRSQRQRMADAIRFLAMDGVQAANSGHPGMPMGMADAAVALFADHIHVDPTWGTSGSSTSGIHLAFSAAFPPRNGASCWSRCSAPTAIC